MYIANVAAILRKDVIGILCKFSSSSNTYTFLTSKDIGLVPGNQVIAETRYGLKVIEVIEVDVPIDLEVEFEYMWAFQKVDLLALERLKERAAKDYSLVVQKHKEKTLQKVFKKIGIDPKDLD